MSHPLKVHATWDGEAKVWVAESEDVVGLITEAATPEELMRKLSDIIPVLLEENGGGNDMPEVPYS
jgi:predicted RNase H-like HicB family nuclease